MSPAPKGRVGVNPSALEVHEVKPGTVRVTCANNPEFWMEVDLTTQHAVGGARMGDGDQADGFHATIRDGTVRIDSLECPSFWLEIYM